VYEDPYGFDAQLNIAICLECKSGIFKEHLKNHSNKKHKKNWFAINSVWNSVLNLEDAIPTIEHSHPYLQIIEEAYQCMHCFEVLKTNNMQQKHKSKFKSHQTYQRCAAINIFKQKAKWQRIQQATQTSLEPNSIQAILNQPVTITNNSRWKNVQHCYIVLGWVEYVKQMVDDDLKNYIKYNKLSVIETDEFNVYISVDQVYIDCIKTHCNSFLSNINNSMYYDNYHSRLSIGRYLILSNSSVDEVTKAFKPLKLQSTVTRYANTLAELIIFIIRFDISKIEYRLDEWKNLLNKDEGEQYLMVIELLEIALNESHSIDTGRVRFIAIQYIISKALNNNLEFLYPNVLTQYLAHLEYSTKAITLYNIMNLSDQQDFDLINQKRNQYLAYVRAITVTSGPNAFFAIHSTRMLLTKASEDISFSDNVNWVVNPVTRELDYTQLLYQGILVTFENVKNGYRSVFDKIQLLLDQLLPLDVELPRFNTINDLSSDTTSGYNFMENKLNGSLIELGQEGMQYFNQFLKHEDGQWNMNHVNQFQTIVNELCELLLFGIHISSGQPARASEYKQMQFRNFNGIRRSLYISYNTICIKQYYQKQTWLNGRYANISRFLPSDLGYLYLKYLIFIRPTQT